MNFLNLPEKNPRNEIRFGPWIRIFFSFFKLHRHRKKSNCNFNVLSPIHRLLLGKEFKQITPLKTRKHPFLAQLKDKS